MTSFIDELFELDPAQQRAIMAGLSMAERSELQRQIDFRIKHPWLKYQGDPVGFVEKGLKETIWGKQREILTSLMEHKRTAVPATHAPGKTHIAARAIAYWASCYPPGTARVITTAPSGNQVKNIMWPHIRRLQAEHKLPGFTNSLAWRMGDPPIPLADGIKPPDDDEAGVQGYHAPNLLIVVDEAGGIHPTFGRSLEALMTGHNTRLLLLGNPPTETENSWFEACCSNSLYNVVRISAFDTPAYTGEPTGICKTCPPEVGPHEIVTHLVGKEWVDGVREQFGEDSPIWIARVLAQFPRDNTAKALPFAWLDESMKTGTGDEGRINLGVDIASDGGDEFVIAKLDGWKATIEYANAGVGNEDATKVAGMIKRHILEAEAEHKRRGIVDRVRVKVDAIGVGWGVVSILKKQQRNNEHNALVIGVNVAEQARNSKKFINQRAEMWWATRDLIQPNTEGEPPLLKLDIDTKVLAQLNAPQYFIGSSGRIQIEKKVDLKKRGVHSPDRAEAVLLAVFEPPNAPSELFTPLALPQSNVWDSL